MEVCFIPNLGEKRRLDEPKWGAEFFAEAFVKYSRNNVTVQNDLDDLDRFDVVWVHNIANMLRGLKGRINFIRKTWRNKTPIIGGVRGLDGYRISKPYLGFFDAVHTSNEGLAVLCSKYNYSFSLPSGVDPEWYGKHVKPKTFTVGWAGDMSKNMKNVGVVKKLPYPIVIQDKSNYIPHEDMPEKFYNKISVLVHPSSHEGSNRVISEAAFMGVPVVCTDVGHNRSIVQDDLLFSLDEPGLNRVVEVLSLLDSDSVFYDSVRCHNLVNSEKYSWVNVIDQADLICNITVSI